MSNHPYRALAPATGSNFVQVNAKSPVPRQVKSKDEWESIKPEIRRLYMKENLPFRKITAILGENYGFAPTESQFKKRVLKWGFRKNVSPNNKCVGKRDDRRSNGTHSKVFNEAVRIRRVKDLKNDLDIITGKYIVIH